MYCDDNSDFDLNYDSDLDDVDSYIDSDYQPIFAEDDLIDIEDDFDYDMVVQRDTRYQQRRPYDQRRATDRRRPQGQMTRPAPNYTPRRPYGRRRSRDIERCIGRTVYIWLSNGSSFWAIITRVRGRTVEGQRWNGRRWIYFSSGINSINNFVCV